MTEQRHILVVDDDRRLRDLLKRYLSQNGFLVTAVQNAAEAEDMLKNMEFDIMVLDVMMPGISGLDLAKKLRGGKKQVPILLLTAKDTPDDRIAGLEHGADDYLTKPFEPRELVLRLQSILRRTGAVPQQTAPMPSRVEFGGFSFDIKRGELLRETKPVALTSAEISLLTTLAENAHSAMSREQLVQICAIEGGERAIDVQVTRLRRKIEEDPGFPRYLQTIRGRGYVLKPEQIIMPEA